jgi:hypothetical protein
VVRSSSALMIEAKMIEVTCAASTNAIVAVVVTGIIEHCVVDASEDAIDVSRLPRRRARYVNKKVIGCNLAGVFVIIVCGFWIKL